MKTLKKLCIYTKPGRPSTNKMQSILMNASIELSVRDTGAHKRRLSNSRNFSRTLEDLTRELNTLSFNLSRLGVYLRLIPRN